MKVLLIGYGSIGKRHEEVLLSFHDIKSIDIVTKQILKNKQTFVSLKDVNNLGSYDYFIIASETNKHYEQLSYLENNTEGKIIFCEKPLFETKKELTIKNNEVFIGYVLRFHPLLQKLKAFIKDERVISVNAKCGQYLPSWRPDTDYEDSYSAKKSEGGGVLLDLSHEIDYVQYLCGELKELKSYQVKISDLEIDSDDLTMIIGKSVNNSMASVSIDYISKITHRELFVDTNEHSYRLDFILNELTKKDKKGLEEKFSCSNLERNQMLEEMHKDILKNRKEVCSYKEGLEVMKTISTIQEQNR